MDYVFPTSASLRVIAQELVPRMAAARPIFSVFPMVNDDNWLLEWEQKDNYSGLQQIRGLNGEPTRIRSVGRGRFYQEPGVYGEFDVIDEKKLTMMRAPGMLAGAPIDIGSLVAEAQVRLLGRRLDRIEKMEWDLLLNGTFSVANFGQTLQTDSYTTQTYGSGLPWATPTTATPLADFRAVQLLSRGYSVDFGRRAQAFMNRGTWNNLMRNTNAADMGGRRVLGGATVNDPAAALSILAGEDLPTPVIYDEGYVAENTDGTPGAFTLFIPNNKVVVIGARKDGDPVAEYRMTRNANNPAMAPGEYMAVVDTLGTRFPRQIQVHDGHNGGPVLFHPAAVVIITV